MQLWVPSKHLMQCCIAHVYQAAARLVSAACMRSHQLLAGGAMQGWLCQPLARALHDGIQPSCHSDCIYRGRLCGLCNAAPCFSWLSASNVHARGWLLAARSWASNKARPALQANARSLLVASCRLLPAHTDSRVHVCTASTHTILYYDEC